MKNLFNSFVFILFLIFGFAFYNFTLAAPPLPPAGLSAAPGACSTGVNLSWTDSYGATSYNVLRSTTSGSGYVQVGTSNTSPYNDTTVYSGATYYFVVQAVNEDGASENSEQASVIAPLNCVPPSIQSPIAFNISYTSAMLRSTIVSSGVPPPLTARGHCYSKTSDNSNPDLTLGVGVICVPHATVATGPLNTTLSGLTMNTSYSYKGYATNSTGTSYTTTGTFVTASTMAGTLTPSASSCTIPNNSPSCAITLTFNIGNPEIPLGSLVTSNVDNNGNSSPNFTVTPPVSTGNADTGTKTGVSVPNLVRTFYLYNNGKLLAQTTVTASCNVPAGFFWDGSICTDAQPSYTPISSDTSLSGVCFSPDPADQRFYKLSAGQVRINNQTYSVSSFNQIYGFQYSADPSFDMYIGIFPSGLFPYYYSQLTGQIGTTNGTLSWRMTYPYVKIAHIEKAPDDWTITSITHAHPGSGCVDYTPTMSGTITDQNSHLCVISANASSCNVNLNWRINHAEAVPTQITALGMAPITVSTSLTPTSQPAIINGITNSIPVSVSVPYPGRTFYLYNNAKSIAPTSPNGSGVTVNAQCAYGSVWNGYICANTLPGANAGPDKSILLPTSTTSPTGATATPTPPYTIISTIWTQVGSSPSMATINSAGTLNPTFSGLTASGTYTFRLTVIDNQNTIHTDDMLVVVSANGSSMSGILSPSSNSCAIGEGAKSCPVILTWNVNNPEVPLGTAITSNKDNDGNPSSNFTVSPPATTGNADSGTKLDVSIPFAVTGRTFYLYNNSKLLTQAIVTASCDLNQGLGWDGEKCSKSQPSPIITAFSTDPLCIDTSLPNTCDNGATNYPDCNNICVNGAPDYPDCINICTNGATNYPTCNNNTGGGGGGDGIQKICMDLCGGNGDGTGIGGQEGCYSNCLANNGGIAYGASSVNVTLHWNVKNAEYCGSPAGLFDQHSYIGLGSGVHSDEALLPQPINPATFVPTTYTLQCTSSTPSQVVTKSYTLNTCEELEKTRKIKYGEGR